MSGASSLLSKYTTLSNSITATRQSISSNEAEISSIQTTLISLQTNHESMQQDLHSAISESKHLSKSISSRSRAEIEYQSLIRDDMGLRQKTDLIRAQMNRLKQERKISKRDFWQSCREFRMAVRRGRVSLEGFVEDDKVNGNVNDNVNDNDNVTGRSSSSSSSSPCGEGTEDPEIEHAQRQKEQSTQIVHNSKELYQKAERQKRKLEKEARDRVKNLQQQRNQLDRVRKDVQEMERELVQLEQGTKECEQISHGYEKDAMRRRQNQRGGAGVHGNSTPRNAADGNNRNAAVTPSPNLRNENDHRNRFHAQYNSSSNARPRINNGATFHNPYNKQVSNPYKRKFPSSNINGNGTSTSNQSEPHTSTTLMTEQLRTQHPHRAGRIRVDRQFTSAISLGVCKNANDDTPYVEDGNGNSNSDVHRGHDREKDNRNGLAIGGNDGSDVDDLNTMCTNTASLGSSSDDDDDDVLTFIPFKHNE